MTKYKIHPYCDICAKDFQSVVDQLKAENDWYKEKNLEWQKKYDTDIDQLRAENERLREGLKKIYDLVNDSNTQYAVELVITMQETAQQALNEVTK